MDEEEADHEVGDKEEEDVVEGEAEIIAQEEVSHLHNHHNRIKLNVITMIETNRQRIIQEKDHVVVGEVVDEAEVVEGVAVAVGVVDVAEEEEEVEDVVVSTLQKWNEWENSRRNTTETLSGITWKFGITSSFHHFFVFVILIYFSIPQDNDIATFPRPVYHRIPNFVGSDQAAMQLLKIPEFNRARIVKVNPDRPQTQCRYLTLKRRKRLFVPPAGLKKNAILTEIKIPPHLQNDEKTLRYAATRKGFEQYGKLLTLHDMIDWDKRNKIDVVIIGSVAIDTETGYRIGKGEGMYNVSGCTESLCILHSVLFDLLILVQIYNLRICRYGNSCYERVWTHRPV